MRTPLQEVVRRKLIEGRQNTWFRNGLLVYGRESSATYRLLQFPSMPFRYSGIVIRDSATWRTQKVVEFLTKEDVHLWAGLVTFRVTRAVQENTLARLHEFLKLAWKSQPHLFLDSDTGFWNEEWPDWMLTYRSTATIEQHTAEGVVTRRGNTICRISVEGSAIQP